MERFREVVAVASSSCRRLTASSPAASGLPGSALTAVVWQRMIQPLHPNKERVMEIFTENISETVNNTFSTQR